MDLNPDPAVTRSYYNRAIASPSWWREHNSFISIISGTVVTSEESISASAKKVNLMEATRLRARPLRWALRMLKMQVQEPGIFGIGCEVVGRSQRRSAKLDDGVLHFC